MDSDNSGSQQSSSGGDEEYDSRAAAVDSISAFINIHPTVTPPQVSLFPNPTLFDPISGYPDPYPYPPPLLNPGISWPRSDPISAYSAALMSSSFQADNIHGATAPPVLPASGTRNPKKRSRASRRAPTTVLTTDTTNFRAMVQEFTGIPAPPFGGPLSRNRLDLSALPPSYLRRPFPQKFHSPHFHVSAPASSPLLTEPSSVQLPFTQTSNVYDISNQFNPKFPFSGSFLQSIKPPEIPSDEFGAGLGCENVVSSNRNALRNDRSEATSAVEGNDEAGLINGNYGSFPGINNSNSNPQTENITRRSEGMMEPWISSSE